MGDRMLTPEEVARRLAVTPNTVRGWLREGALKGVKVGKRVWRIEEHEIQNYICKERSAPYGIENKHYAKQSEKIAEGSGAEKEYLRAREALKIYKGSLSDVIREERNE
jgi:excisionase family DNA binding protein